MEDSVTCSYSNTKNDAKSIANSSTALTSDIIISPNKGDQYDLRWPSSQERDFTQIIVEDTSHTKSNILNTNGNGRQTKEIQRFTEVISYT